MSGPAPILRELHRLRKHLRDLQTEIERAPRLLKAHQAKLAQQEAGFRDAQEGLKRLKVAVHENEVSLKSTHQQLTKYEKQLNEVTSKREMDGKQSEIAQARQRLDELETKILEGMTEIEERTTRLPEQEKHAQQARAEFAEFEKGQQARLARLQQEKGNAEKELAATEAKLPADIRSQYARLAKAHGADALAVVTDRTCMHCRTGITAQQQNELEGERFVTCKSCGRGLYLPATAAVPEG
jgi:predicted  nucleic acid-binding Zn-ribbon protein